MVEWSNVFYGVGFIVVFGFMWKLLSPVFLPIFQSLMKNIRFGADVGISKKEGYLRRI
jgi:hypothetical protein